MKVLVVYGGPNNGLKERDSGSLLKSGSKQVNVAQLNLNTQFLIKTVKSEFKNQKVAAVDDIEVICRHFTDLKDFIYEQQDLVPGAQMVHEVKQLF